MKLSWRGGGDGVGVGVGGDDGWVDVFFMFETYQSEPRDWFSQVWVLIVRGLSCWALESCHVEKADCQPYIMNSIHVSHISWMYTYQSYIMKIRWSHERLIFNMGIPIPGKDHLYVEMGPCSPHSRTSYHQIWHHLKGARYRGRVVWLLWNLTDACQSPYW